MFPTVWLVSNILSLHNIVQPSISKHFQTPGDRVFPASNLEKVTNSVDFSFSPWLILLIFLITKASFGIDAFCMHTRSRWRWRHVHLIESAWQMWRTEIMNMQLTDAYAMYIHILGSRDTDFLWWKTERAAHWSWAKSCCRSVSFKRMT